MKYYNVSLQVDFNNPRERPPTLASKKPWKAIGYFQTFFCTEDSKENAKKLVNQYVLNSESDPSNCRIKYERIAWMRFVTKFEDISCGSDNNLTQEMFDNRNKVGIWYVGNKEYYVSEEDACAEMVEDHNTVFNEPEEFEIEFDDWEDENEDSYDGQCQACDNYGSVNDMMLCKECAGKLERDLIRQGEWDYCSSAFGISKADLVKLQKEIIKNHGKKMELIVPRSKKKK